MPKTAHNKDTSAPQLTSTWHLTHLQWRPAAQRRPARRRVQTRLRRPARRRPAPGACGASRPGWWRRRGRRRWISTLPAMDYCDGAGIALLIQLRRLQQKAGGKLEIHGLRPEFQELLDDVVPRQQRHYPKQSQSSRAARRGDRPWRRCKSGEDIHELICIRRRIVPALWSMRRSIRAAIRWRDTLAGR